MKMDSSQRAISRMAWVTAAVVGSMGVQPALAYTADSRCWQTTAPDSDPSPFAANCSGTRYVGTPGPTISASESASSNLHTAVQSSSATSQRVVTGLDVSEVGGRTSTTLTDRVTVDGPWNGNTIAVTLQMQVMGTVHVDGQLTQDPRLTDPGYPFQPTLLPAGVKAQAFVLINGDQIGTEVDVGFDAAGSFYVAQTSSVFDPEVSPPGSSSPTIDPATLGSASIFSSTTESILFDLTATILLSEANPYFDFKSRLGVDTTFLGNGTVDFTSVLSLVLPDGFSFSSDSGAFLAAAPVPLPAAIWLLLSDVCGLYGVNFRRRAAD